jgi:hypothetical protein
VTIDSPALAGGPRYISSSRTAQKTSLPTVTSLLHVNSRYLVMTVALLQISCLEQICHSIKITIDNNVTSCTRMSNLVLPSSSGIFLTRSCRKYIIPKF